MGSIERSALSPLRVLQKRVALWALVTVSVAPVFGQIGDFGGPSILSRGGARPGQRGNTALDFTVFGGVSGTVTTDPTGTAGGKDVAYGEAANLGVTGSHRWERTFLGLDYLGSYHRYSGFSLGNGFEQSLALQYDHELGRHWLLNVRESASMTKLALGGVASYGFFTNDLIGVPVNNLFDSYAYSTQTSAAATWRKSARFTTSFFGDAFQVHRTSKALVGVRGYRTGFAAGYRVARHDELTATYSFVHFSFPRAFGASDLHGVQLGWNHQFSRYWSGTLGAGGYRVETLGTQSVALSPDVAAILGRSTGIRAIYRVSYAPSLSATLNYRYQRSNFTLAAASGVSPGNGVYLTSRTNTANLGYSYSGFRRASMSANFGYAEYSSLFQEVGKYSSWIGGLGTGYRITDYMSLTATFDIRQFQISSGAKRVAETASLGIAFAPYRVPIPSF